MRDPGWSTFRSDELQILTTISLHRNGPLQIHSGALTSDIVLPKHQDLFTLSLFLAHSPIDSNRAIARSTTPASHDFVFSAFCHQSRALPPEPTVTAFILPADGET